MQDINRVTIVGRLVDEAKIRTLQTGTTLANFAVAVNRKTKKNGEWTEEASYFDCTIWGRLAEAIGSYLQKGKQVAVDGELVQDRWEQDGQKRSKVKITANSVQLLGGRGDSNGSSQPQQPAQQTAASPGAANPHQNTDPGAEFDDDVPF